MIRIVAIFILMVLIPSYGSVQAQPIPADVFGDHMVLQQQMPIRIWGSSGPNEKIKISISNSSVSVRADASGNWEAILPAMKAGGPFILTMKGKRKLNLKDVYVGEVWLCSGQSNMDMTVAKEDRHWCGVVNEEQEVAEANYPLIRVFDVPFVTSDTLCHSTSSKWEICSPLTVGHFSAAAYFFARDLQKVLNVPIGLITSAYGASTVEAWTQHDVLILDPQMEKLVNKYKRKKLEYDTGKQVQLKYQLAMEKWTQASLQATKEGKSKPREPRHPDPRRDQHSPSVLLNGMIWPLVPYAIRGTLWYQGESNGATSQFYERQMEALVGNWRSVWKQDSLPFIYVQLANHQQPVKEPVKDDPMVFVREAQLKNLSIPNTAMVVAIDNADPLDPDNIHPKDKQTIGYRLSLAARKLAYKENIIASGPIFKSIAIEGSTVRVSFDHAEGLNAKGFSLEGFAVAGADKVFVWADAAIEGNTVVVSSPEVKDPVAVRYGWSKNPPVNLYNKAGLPASPFRSDVTGPSVPEK